MLANTTPQPNGTNRAAAAQRIRHDASDAARSRPAAVAAANGEERDHGSVVPANFTKGLAHTDYGLVADHTDYARFVQAINGDDDSRFETDVVTAADGGATSTVQRAAPHAPGDTTPGWRGRKSPRA